MWANLIFSLYIAYFTLHIPHKLSWHYIFSKKTIFYVGLFEQLKAGEGGVHWKSFYLGRLYIKEI